MSNIFVWQFKLLSEGHFGTPGGSSNPLSVELQPSEVEMSMIEVLGVFYGAKIQCRMSFIGCLGNTESYGISFLLNDRDKIRWDDCLIYFHWDKIIYDNHFHKSIFFVDHIYVSNHRCIKFSYLDWGVTSICIIISKKRFFVEF